MTTLLRIIVVSVVAKALFLESRWRQPTTMGWRFERTTAATEMARARIKTARR